MEVKSIIVRGCVLSVVAASLAGCGRQNESNALYLSRVEAKRADGSARVDAFQAGGRVIGYQHHMDASAFDIGDGAVEIVEYGYHKFIGSQGVFATDVITGAVLAIPNSGARSLQFGRYGSVGLEHNSYARNYFVSAGVPEEQIGSVSLKPLVEREGTSLDANSPTNPVVIAYYSALRRVVAGIEVPESIAWVRFNSERVAVSETVYWPEIDQAVVDSAVELRDRLLDNAALAAYRSLLPVDASVVGEVVIHHTKHTTRSPYRTFATYDVMQSVPAGSAYERHFSGTGSELRLPEEGSLPPDARSTGVPQ